MATLDDEELHKWINQNERFLNQVFLQRSEVFNSDADGMSGTSSCWDEKEFKNRDLSKMMTFFRKFDGVLGSNYIISDWDSDVKDEPCFFLGKKVAT